MPIAAERLPRLKRLPQPRLDPDDTAVLELVPATAARCQRDPFIRAVLETIRTYHELHYPLHVSCRVSRLRPHQQPPGLGILDPRGDPLHREFLAFTPGPVVVRDAYRAKLEACHVYRLLPDTWYEVEPAYDYGLWQEVLVTHASRRDL